MYRDSEMAIWFSSGVGADALHRAGAARQLAGAAGDRDPGAAGVAVGQPQQRRAARALRAALRPLARDARACSRPRATAAACSSSSGDRDEAMHARDVFVLANDEHDESLTSARSAHVENIGTDRFLVLDSGQRKRARTRQSGERTLASFARYQRAGRRAAGAKRVDALAARRMPTVDLVRDPTPRNQGELIWRLGLLFGAVNLVLLAIGLAATQPAPGDQLEPAVRAAGLRRLLQPDQPVAGLGGGRQAGARPRAAAGARRRVRAGAVADVVARPRHRVAAVAAARCAARRAAQHENGAPPAVPRHRRGRWSSWRSAFLSLFFFIDFVDELENIGRNGYTVVHAAHRRGAASSPGTSTSCRRSAC